LAGVRGLLGLILALAAPAPLPFEDAGATGIPPEVDVVDGI
jgi:hypothetical protein